MAVQAANNLLGVTEFPEDLGAVRGGKWNGTRPASIWQWTEMQDLRKFNHFHEFGIRQSDYGAEYLKPTRIVFLGRQIPSLAFEGPPIFNTQGFYEGPVPKADAGALGLKTLAKKAHEQGFRTTGTAAWPAKL